MTQENVTGKSLKNRDDNDISEYFKPQESNLNYDEWVTKELHAWIREGKAIGSLSVAMACYAALVAQGRDHGRYGISLGDGRVRAGTSQLAKAADCDPATITRCGPGKSNYVEIVVTPTRPSGKKRGDQTEWIITPIVPFPEALAPRNLHLLRRAVDGEVQLRDAVDGDIPARGKPETHLSEEAIQEISAWWIDPPVEGVCPNDETQTPDWYILTNFDHLSRSTRPLPAGLHGPEFEAMKECLGFFHDGSAWEQHCAVEALCSLRQDGLLMGKAEARELAKQSVFTPQGIWAVVQGLRSYSLPHTFARAFLKTAIPPEQRFSRTQWPNVTAWPRGSASSLEPFLALISWELARACPVQTLARMAIPALTTHSYPRS